MSDELIRKSEVLELIDSLNISDRQNYEDLIFNIEDMTPVNAVELPCKVGDTVYEPCKYHKKIYAFEVKGFTISEKVELINLETRNFFARELGEKIFLAREEAEKALEDLKNE